MTSGGAQDLVFRYGLENGLLLYGFVDYVTLAGVGGDFNGDGTYDCLDVNALTGVIAAGSNDAAFDLTGDGSVDGDDLNAWLTEAGAAELPSGNPFRLGDANLDGFVDVSDFNVWNSNRFSTRPEWCSADFNADGVVDVSDFNLWNGNKFTASSLAAVPEPMGWGWLLTLTGGWLGLAARQRLGRDDGGPAPSAAARK